MPRWSTEEAIEAFKKGYDAAVSGSMRLLVVRRIGMGDVVQALIVAEALKRRYQCELTFQTTPDYFTLCERVGFIDSLRSSDEGESGYEDFDLVIDLHQKIDFLPYCATAPRLDLMALSAKIEWSRLDFNYRIPFLPEDEEYGEAFVRQHGLRQPIIGVHANASSPLRQWEASDAFVEMLAANGFNVICLGLEARPNLWDVGGVVANGVTNVDHLLGLLSQCEAVVCVDSGVMHLCGITETPFLALFGPISPELRILYFRRRRWIYLNHLPCTPCHDWQLTACEGRAYHKQCMTDITPNMVLEELLRFREDGYVDDV